jgi:amino acid transporter, AAT family
MLAVHVFGEMEFWFALIKVSMIVMLIVGGLAVILFGVGNLGATAGFSNLFSHGGFLPFGILGVLLTFQMVMFGFQGVELIGVTAGEAENPEVVLPSATNSIIYRILIFYIGALIVIMSLVPWNQIDPRTSPFVLVFDRASPAPPTSSTSSLSRQRCRLPTVGSTAPDACFMLCRT